MSATAFATALALIAGPSSEGVGRLRCRELVVELADPSFRVREDAARDLVRLGYFARAALEDGTRHPDPEVADRCRRLLPQAIEWHVRQLLARLEADPALPIPDELPEAPRWKKVAGETKEARELFVELARDHRRILSDAARSPRKVAELYRDFCQGIYARGRGAVSATGRNSAATRSELALFLFLGAHPGHDRPALNAGSYLPVSNLLGQAELSRSLAAEGGSEPVKKLFVAWMAKEQHPTVLRRALTLAATANLKEAVPVGLKLIGDKGLVPTTRAYVILALARLGDRTLVEKIEPFLSDETRVGALRFGGGEPMTVQMRDVAMAACVILAKESPAEFGFERARSTGVAVTTSYTYYGFASDEKREAAHKKWKEWWAEQRKK